MAKVQTLKLQELVLSAATNSESRRTSGGLISSLLEPAVPTLTILDGPGGFGKTTLLKNALQSLAGFCLYVDLGSDKLLNNEKVFLECIESALKGRMKGLKPVLFLFDALDVFLSKCKWDLNAFFSIIKKKVLKTSSLLIATRSSGVDCLYKNLEKIDHHYVVEGFSPESMMNYFKMSEEFEQISRLLLHHRNILPGMCKVPLICSQLVEILKEKKIRTANLTITEIVYEIVLAIVNREIQKTDLTAKKHSNLYSFKNFPVLSNLAFLDLVYGNELDSLESFSLFLSTFSIDSSLGSLDEVNSLNLMNHCDYDSVYASTKQRLYWFLTPEIRDFLAAFYLHLCAPLDQLYVISEKVQSLTRSGYSGWLQFFYGLTVKREAVYNPTRMMMSSLNELLAYCLDFNESLQLIIFIQCITETREPSLWKKFAAKHSSFLSIDLSAKDVEMTEVDLVNLINSSGCKDWVIEVSAQFSLIAERLQAFVTANLEIRKVEALGEKIQLWPKIAPAGDGGQEMLQSSHGEVLSAEQRVLKIGIFFCRAIREILQRVLQLYTEFTVRGDSSSASYVSFLSCSCFKKAIKNKLSFQPIVPSKFFTIENASRKAGRKGSDANTTAHLKEEHADKAVELVILLFPCVKTVRFILPSGEDTQEIHLRGKHMPDSSYDQSMPPDLEEVVQCSAAQDYFPSRTESVLPDMPLNTKVSTVVPSISLPPADKRPSSVTEHVTEEDDVTESTPRVTESLQPQNLYFALQESNEGGPYLKVSSVFNPNMHISTFQPPPSVAVQPVQQQHSRRLATMKPGTVIFTADPTKIPIDYVFPLPDMSMLIQSGGNGQIFACTVQGMDIVMKKTSYRSKEYAIITKVRHENVIQLLAFVMGEENPAHKRRFFCYHVISQMKGDLARMVTDHKERLLMNLHRTHVEDHSLVGAIRSNTAAVLSGVLSGLAYLHSLHIAHRDIKASNILLKPHCSCNNPILCLCATKWEVVICDFDAAVQLDVHDQLPPVSFPSSQTMQAIAPQYHSVPVGTNGFRAPECSMYTTTNFPDAFSPRVSTQCDLFSFGLLCQRLMIGEEGPYRQRTLALLLLYYHQSVGSVEGRWKTGLEVSRATVNQVLKFEKLRSEMEWFEHAVDLVQCCLKVDPQERHPANQLLLHPFFHKHSLLLQQQTTTTTTTTTN